MFTNKFNLKKLFISLFLIFILLLLILISLDWYTTPQLEPSSKPKILITNHHEGYCHGHYTYIRSITKNLNHKYRFAIAAPGTSQIYNYALENKMDTFDCNYELRRKSLFFYISNFFKFRTICKNFQPDIIHSNGPLDKTFAVWATIFLKSKPKIIRTYHVTKILKKDIYHRILCNNRINMNLFVSKSAFQLNVDKNGFIPKHYRIIENGVDTSLFKPTKKNYSLKESLNIPKNNFVFGSCAGLSDYKRIDLILEASKKLKNKYDFHVVVLGGNHEKWLKRAIELGVNDIFHFPSYQTDTVSYCSIFDAGFVLSTGLETTSYALREMLSMGIPCIASNYSGLKDSVLNKQTGLLVEPGSVESLIVTMEIFLNMPEADMEKYKKNARNIVLDKFTLKEQIIHINNLYKDLLK